MSKLKFCFYTMRSFEKVEHFLENMENQGYILKRKVLFYLFLFKKTKPKHVNYFLSFSPSGGSISMHDLETRLKGELHAAILLKGNFFFPSIYRICDTNKDLLPFKKERNSILKQICVHQIIISLIGGLLIEFPFIVFKEFISGNWALHLLLHIPVLHVLLYNLVSYIVIRKKYQYFVGSQG